LLVYNTLETPPVVTDPDLTFLKGIFVWTGLRWESIRVTATNALSFTGVDNGISLSNGTIQLGGELSNSSTEISVDADSQDFAINIENNSSAADHGFFIKGLETQLTSSSAIVADVNTGKLGLSPVIPAKLAFFQSATESLDIAVAMNTGNPYPVPWTEADCVTNNLLNFNDTENAFELKEDCMIEISAMVAYKGGNGSAQIIRTYTGSNNLANSTWTYDPSIIVVNATLQLNKADEGEWKNYSSVRGVYVGSVNAFRNTLNIPPTLLLGKAGDKIRLVIQRPATDPTGQSSYVGLGSDHVDDESGIVVPYGTSFSKSIKIIAQ
jgi:hypothetical protein